MHALFSRKPDTYSCLISNRKLPRKVRVGKRNFSRNVGYLEPYNLPPPCMASASPPGSPYRKQAGKLGCGMPSPGTRAAASPVTPEKAAWIFTFPAGMIPDQHGLGAASELLPAPCPGWSCPCLLSWFCSVPAGTGPVTGMENTLQGHGPTALRND